MNLADQIEMTVDEKGVWIDFIHLLQTSPTSAFYHIQTGQRWEMIEGGGSGPTTECMTLVPIYHGDPPIHNATTIEWKLPGSILEGYWHMMSGDGRDVAYFSVVFSPPDEHKSLWTPNTTSRARD